MEDAILYVFGQPLTRFGLCCAGALLAGLLACGIRMKQNGRNYGDWIRFSICVLFFAWLFARLLFAFADWIMILLEGIFDLETGRDPLSVIYFWRGGYSLMGGVLGALIGAKAAEKWTGAGKGTLADTLAFGLPVAILLERLAEIGTGLGQGRYVTAKWLIDTGLCPEVYGEHVQPVYLYEALVALVLLIVMILLSRRERTPGTLLEIFLLLFGLTQVVMESLRADGHMVEHFVHIQQVYAILFAVGVILRWCLRMKRTKGWGGRAAAGWAVILAAAGLAIWAEFGVDRWGKPLLAYGLMICCMAVIGLVGFYFLKHTESSGR